MVINQQREFQKLVTTLATEFINLPPEQFDSGINRMLAQIGEFIGADRAYIYQFSDDLSIANMCYEWCSLGIAPDIEGEQNIRTHPFSMVFEKFKQGEADFIPRVLDLPESRIREKALLISRSIQARITLPLFSGDTLVGSMGFHAMKSEPDWADYTVDLLKIVGEIYLNLEKRRLVENQLNYQASLLQNVTDIVIATNLQLTITSWNQAAEHIFGFTEEQVIGKRVETVIKSDFTGVSRGDMIRAFNKDEKWQGEIQHYDKDNNLIDLWVSISAIKDTRGEVLGAVYIYHDLKQRKDAEKHELELRIQAERIQVLEQIMSDLSHDFKTPLAAIKMMVYMLERNKDPVKQGEYIKRMTVQIERLTRLVDDVLTMSRLEKGVELIFAPVKLSSFLKNLSDSYSHLANDKEQKLVLELSSELPTIQANESELNRAFSNLIENALNYTPPGNTITINSFITDDEIVIEIRDTGIGISEEDLPQIFDRFYRADKARDTSRGGTGLGLAIVKRIIELHQAEIEVQSQLDAGTTFSIHFPLNSIN